jgi:uncharacterized protein
MLPTRDGTRLATDVYRPANAGELTSGSFPTVLVRTSYDKSAKRYSEIAEFFTPLGYAVVLQDFRGRFNSEGVGQYFHTANVNEGRDGYDTVEWIAAQSWSNGRIGTVGSSHAGIAQTHLALYKPPHLAAMWPDVTPINSFDHQVRRGGVMQMQMFGALFVHALDAPEIRNNEPAKRTILDAMQSMRELVYGTPFIPGQTPLAVVPTLEKTLFDYYYRADYDEFWAAEFNDFQRYFDRHADVPTTLTGGWYDPFAIATTDYFAQLASRNLTKQRLIMGPWNHTGMRFNLSYIGEVDFGPDSVWGNKRYFNEQLRWFDRWLRDSPNGVEGDPPVQIFVMGGGDGRRTAEGKLNHGGTWREEKEWPLARTVYQTFYLRSDGQLNLHPPHQNERSLMFTFDPRTPVPTIGAAASGLFELMPIGGNLDPFWSSFISPWARLRSIIVEGPAHQQEGIKHLGSRSPYLPLSAREDVLVFQTQPLQQNLEVTGTIEVVLWISSSAVDTDFTAKLIDVHPPNEDYPEGFDMNLTDSIIRTRYRNGFEKSQLMEPGKIYQIKIVLPPTSNLFKAGHRIRVDISSSNFPRFELNPNTGEPTGRHTSSVVAKNTIYVDSNHSSYVLVPVIPN